MSLNRFIAGALIAVGALIFTLCGACTLIVGGVMISEHGHPDDLILPLVIGGVPTAVGFVLFFIGRTMMRKIKAGEQP
jgi:hypothetical protein